METNRTYYEYFTVIYDHLNEKECEQADKIMDDNKLEFVSRRPRGGSLVLTARREITEPPSIYPLT